MSETLTVDTTPQTETLGDNLTPDEQDSLKVGEEMMNQQDQLLAGKYKDAEALEKAYIELQKKLGDDSQEEESEVTEEPEETPDENPAMSLINSANEEFFNNDNSLSDETLEKFSQMSSKDLVEAYMEIQKNQPQEKAEIKELSDSDVNTVKNYVGGEQSYDTLINWASENLDEGSINAFDDLVSSGNVEAIKLAAYGLKAQYENENGYEGRTFQGKPPRSSGDVFRSQAEVVEAMSNPKYDRDPAYRQDILEKLDRSDIQF